MSMYFHKFLVLAKVKQFDLFPTEKKVTFIIIKHKSRFDEIKLS